MDELDELKQTQPKNHFGLPLAIATVPYQTWNNTYEIEAALKIGTIFPELNLPFYAGGDLK